MKHKLILVITTILTALLAACTVASGETGVIIGSGTIVDRSFDLSGFARIDANNTAQVQVTRGDGFRVEVQVDDNLEPRLDVAVSGDTLHIRLENGSYSNITLRAEVTMPRLNGVTLNGASALSGQLDGESPTLNLNGASRITLTGSAGRVTIDANGASQALLGGLAAGDVQVSANGASHIEVQANGTVRGSANGASSVIVTGSPTAVNVDTTGASQVITN
jgi:hypothetical protein